MFLPSPLHRRNFLKHSAGCLAGSTALYQSLLQAAELGAGHPLAPKPTHFPARAKNLIVIFLTGGFSHVDTFDPKPELNKQHGKSVPGVHLRGTDPMPLMGSPFKFKPYGKSGLMISEIFPHLGEVADDLCVIRSLHTDIVEHFQSVLAMHTGSATVPMPSIGSWLSYGLGTKNPNLPSYVVLCENLPYAGAQVWDNLFLPPVHQGVRLLPGNKPIDDIEPPVASVTLQDLEQQMLQDLNQKHADARPGDLQLTARMNSFSTARGMMQTAPDIFNLAQETQHTRDSYGVNDGDNKSIAWQLLVARRMIERGVRTVELIDTGASNNWDAHGNMREHLPKAQRVDQPIAALLKDLKQRGLLSETLVAICTEFGRTPWTDNGNGRNHYANAFSCLLAGGGVKGGITYGETDEFGIKITKNPAHVHDYHATILHLLGLDHTKLTYRYAGRDYRLTDVSGTVIKEIFS